MYRLIPQALFGPVGPFAVPASRQPLRAFALLLALFHVLGSAGSTLAHEVPGQVLVQALVKPEGNRLRLLMRVPMVAMQDVDFPQHGPGYLTIPDADPSLRQAAMSWLAREIRLYEDDVRLEGQQLVAVMASLPSDRSFATYDQALAHVLGPKLPPATEIVWQQAVLDVLFEYPIRSERSHFSFEPTLARLGQRTETVLRFVVPGGEVRSFDYHGNPGLVRLDPSGMQAAMGFAVLGFAHLVRGVDYSLFLAALVVPLAGFRARAATTASFAIAATVTLLAYTFGLAPNVLWFPVLIEVLIALSIGWLAVQTAVGASSRRRWLVTFGFGLAYGFSFAFALRESLQFAGGQGLTAIIAFDAGIVLAIALLVVVLSVLVSALFAVALPQRAGTLLIAVLIAHTAWQWLLERGGRLLQYDINLGIPVFDVRLLGTSMRWGMLALIVVALVWLLSMVLPALERDGEPRRSSP